MVRGENLYDAQVKNLLEGQGGKALNSRETWHNRILFRSENK